MYIGYWKHCSVVLVVVKKSAGGKILMELDPPKSMAFKVSVNTKSYSIILEV